MSESFDNVINLHAADRPNYGGYGKDLFVTASLRHPASALKQGMFIAQECRRNNRPLEQVLTDMLSAEEILKEIARLANERHGRSSRQTPTRLQPKDIARVLQADFSIAVQLRDLDDEILSRIRAIDKPEEDLVEAVYEVLEDFEYPTFESSDDGR